MNIKERVAALRAEMKQKNIKAYIIPSTDPHISEYVAECWTSRSWISGFTGSAGTVVITDTDAGLWTDSRYFLQADNELKNSGISLHKLGLPETLDYPEWLGKNLQKGDTVGFDGKVVTVALAKKMEKLFSFKGIHLNTEYDFFEKIWIDRPSIPDNNIFEHKIEYAGKSRVEKIADVQKSMTNQDADYHIIATLDDINWLFNIRGRDVIFNPVAVCYAVITKNSAELFIDDKKITDDIRQILTDDGITLKPYNSIAERICSFENSKNVLIDINKVNLWLYQAIPSACTIIEGSNISTLMKACKNETEIQGMKNALRRDAVAMINFWQWLENTVGKEQITEVTAMDKIREFRSEIPLYFGESFNTIAGYLGNGAIVHYGASKEYAAEIKPEGFFLFDSGGQYYDGTTDITRMFHLSEPTQQEKTDYTLVLKGHINLSLAQFPLKTRGSQLDILARKALWDRGQNYLHGTGHGVGCFMNVHEGPQNIRMDENSTTLEPGMILSNEPGLYRAGLYGIRIENLVLVVNGEKTEFGQFLKFENLTLCPIDTKAIDKSLLSEQEINWFNDYHKTVYSEVAPLLDDEKRRFLAEKTKAI
ncbi:MAG: aminopeptidase P family protein [Candidatus Kapabacteria bacterium]|nr:aminopeptidase P family protein [Ignavibacteriota bacterium]MCW5884288.1 aminopeptidase P family protein [Candidatus Kapabacteria bacterium]